METPWAVVMGSWGDAISCYGNICDRLRREGRSVANVVYYGPDQAIVPFLKAQSNIGTVVHSRPPDEHTYYNVVFHATGMENVPIDVWWPHLGLQNHIPITDLWLTMVEYNLHTNPRFFPHRMDLPTDIELVWMEEVRKWAAGRKYVLFQPYSTSNTTTYDQHWDHWQAALKWLYKETKWPIVMCGQQHYLDTYVDVSYDPDRLNSTFIGHTPTMMHAFALANGAAGVVTTTNGMAHWTVVSNKRALVVKNKKIHYFPYFDQYVQQSPNVVLPAEATVGQFGIAFEETFGPNWG